MGACATKPLQILNKAPPMEEENSTPRADATPTPGEITITAQITEANKVDKPTEAVEEKKDKEKPIVALDLDSTNASEEITIKNVEEAVEEKEDKEKPIEATDSKPTTAPEEQRIENVEMVAVVEGKKDEAKPIVATDSKPTTAPVEQKFENIEKVPAEEPEKEIESVKNVVTDATLEEVKS